MNDQKQTLSERILQSAADTALLKKSSAEAYEKSLLIKAEEECEQFLTQEKEAAEARAAEIISRRATLDRLEGRKILLRAKSRAVDEVFQRVTAKLCAMEKTEQLALISRLIEENAERGERVILSEDSPLAVDEVSALAAVQNLSLAVEKGAPVKGGFILAGATYDKVFSFTALAEALRETAEAEVAETLFGSEQA
jgi:vacuolar-type H+-ATPase subunit E/Vma4